MNICRGLSRLNTLRKINKPVQGASFQIIRYKSDHGHDDHGHHDHRDHTGFKPPSLGTEKWYHSQDPEAGKYPPNIERMGLMIMVVTWWWIWHHIFMEPEVLFGLEYPPTHPERWTDEELGIPPDDK